MAYEEYIHGWRYRPIPGSLCHVLYHLACAVFDLAGNMRANAPRPRKCIAKSIAGRMDFYAGKILLLITRIVPHKVGEIHMRPSPTTSPTTKPGTCKRATKPAKPRKAAERPLYAREAAKRFTNFSTKLEALFAKDGQPIPTHIQDLIAAARKHLGCDALGRKPQNIAYLKSEVRKMPKPRRGQPVYPMPDDDGEIPQPTPGTILHPLLPPVPYPRK